MGELTASIGKDESTIRSLTERIDELTEDVGRWTKDKASSADVRGKEAVDFKATALDYSESIDALSGAIKVLKKQAASTAQAEDVQEALLQVRQQRLVPDKAKSVLVAFLQHTEPDEMLFREAPEAYGYEFQSGGVVELLEKLKVEFSSKKKELEAEELKARHSFEQIAQQLTDNVENAEHEVSKKTTSRAATQEAKAESEGNLAST